MHSWWYCASQNFICPTDKTYETWTVWDHVQTWTSHRPSDHKTQCENYIPWGPVSWESTHIIKNQEELDMSSSQWKEDWKSEPKGKIYKFGLWKSFLNFITTCPIYLLVFMLKVNKVKEGLVIIFHKKDSEEFYNLWLCRNAINHKNEMGEGEWKIQ